MDDVIGTYPGSSECRHQPHVVVRLARIDREHSGAALFEGIASEHCPAPNSFVLETLADFGTKPIPIARKHQGHIAGAKNGGVAGSLFLTPRFPKEPIGNRVGVGGEPVDLLDDLVEL